MCIVNLFDMPKQNAIEPEYGIVCAKRDLTLFFFKIQFLFIIYFLHIASYALRIGVSLVEL